MNSHQKSVLVWDPIVRIFHWSLVVSFTVAYLTGEEKNELHIFMGYMVLGLIIFRVIWGFIGSKHALFENFLTSSPKVFGYLKSLFSNKPKHYLGHNPLGGWMVIALLMMLFAVTFSGLKVYALKEGEGPLSMKIEQLSPISTAYAREDERQRLVAERDEVGEDYWTEFHESSTNIMLILIGLHLVGVVVSSKVHKENLVKAMLTGKKTIQR
jgi:cytochrome b